MERKDRIDLTILCIIFALIILLYSYPQKENMSKSEHKEEATVETQASAYKQDIYYLKELNGYLVVYLNDLVTIYEYTSILVDELPEDIQKEIQFGKKLQGIENVYGFLENYSS